MAVDPELGYDPDDRFFYTRELVRELLPMALDGPEPPAAGPAEAGRSAGDPATGGNVQAMILDVRRVLPARDWTRETALRCHVRGDPYPDDVLDTIVERLGGPRA